MTTAAQGQIDRLERLIFAALKRRRRFVKRSGMKSERRWLAYFREVERLRARLRKQAKPYKRPRRQKRPKTLAELIGCPKFQKQMLGRILRAPTILSLGEVPMVADTGPVMLGKIGEFKPGLIVHGPRREYEYRHEWNFEPVA